LYRSLFHDLLTDSSKYDCDDFLKIVIESSESTTSPRARKSADLKMRITSKILDHDAKRLHLFHHMYLRRLRMAGRHQRSAHDQRRVSDAPDVPWPGETMRRLGLMAAAHKALRTPENAGRTIRINAGCGRK
jgi:hypothetical protein